MKAAPLTAVGNPGPSFWEGAAPPSSVLGVGAKIPSSVFGPLSLVGNKIAFIHLSMRFLIITALALVIGTYSIHESNILNQLTVTTLEPKYIIGSLLVPISWGMHVAAWIQKQNKM